MLAVSITVITASDWMGEKELLNGELMKKEVGDTEVMGSTHFG